MTVWLVTEGDEYEVHETKVCATLGVATRLVLDTMSAIDYANPSYKAPWSDYPRSEIPNEKHRWSNGTWFLGVYEHEVIE